VVGSESLLSPAALVFVARTLQPPVATSNIKHTRLTGLMDHSAFGEASDHINSHHAWHVFRGQPAEDSESLGAAITTSNGPNVHCASTGWSVGFARQLVSVLRAVLVY
jgi:hypothetical protein